MVKYLSIEESRVERIKELQRQIYSMECAYDDLLINYKDEWDALHRELRELECTS